MLCIVATANANPDKVYRIDLPAQSVAEALNGLSEQTGVPVVFPYDLTKDRRTHPVTGRYTLQEALDALLEDTGLSGGLSDKGVLTISPSRSHTDKRGETFVTQNDSRQNTSETKPRKPTGIAAFFASLAAAFSAHAQDVDSEPSKVEEIIVTAQKQGEERLQDVPVPVTVLSADELTENGAVLLQDYYSSVPGLNVSDGLYSFHTVTIRGTNSGSGNPTVGVTVDDVPFGSSTTYGYWLPDFDPGDLAQIEVLRGPQGTLYGANSMGGLLKYVTKAPSLEGSSGTVGAGFTSIYNGDEPGYNVRGSANVPLTDSLGIRVSAYTRRDPGFIDNPVYDRNAVNEVESSGGRLAALWQAADNISLTLSAMYQQHKPDAPPEVIVRPGLGELEQDYLPGDKGIERRVQAYSAILKADLGSVDLTSLTGYNVNDSTGTLDWTNAFGEAMQQTFGVSGALHTNDSKITRFTQELRLSGAISERVDWLAGAVYSREVLEQDQHLRAVDTVTAQAVGEYAYFSFPYTGKTSAGFLNLTYRFSDRFDIQLGGRFSHDDITETGGTNTLATPPTTGPAGSESDTFTYLLTPRFRVSPNLMVYARAASGYRPGQTNGAVAGFAPDAPSQSQPDKTKNYEIGLKGNFLDDALFIDASLYRIDWKDIQLQAESSLGGFFYTTNGSEAKSEGAEISVEARPRDGLKIAAWGAYNDAVLTEPFPAASTVYGVAGDRLPQGSRRSGNLSLEQDFPLWNGAIGSIGGDLSYIGDRLDTFTTTPRRTEFPSYTKVDLHFSVSYESWTANLFANNVADKRGVIGTNPYVPSSIIYIQPRTIGLNFSRNF